MAAGISKGSRRIRERFGGAVPLVTSTDRPFKSTIGHGRGRMGVEGYTKTSRITRVITTQGERKFVRALVRGAFNEKDALAAKCIMAVIRVPIEGTAFAKVKPKSAKSFRVLANSDIFSGVERLRQGLGPARIAKVLRRLENLGVIKTIGGIKK